MPGRATFWVVSVLCVLRGGSGYLIDGGFTGPREPVQVQDPFPGYVGRPPFCLRDIPKSTWFLTPSAGAIDFISDYSPRSIEKEYPDIGKELSKKEDPLVLPTQENVDAFLLARELKWAEEEEEARRQGWVPPEEEEEPHPDWVGKSEAELRVLIAKWNREEYERLNVDENGNPQQKLVTLMGTQDSPHDGEASLQQFYGLNSDERDKLTQLVLQDFYNEDEYGNEIVEFPSDVAHQTLMHEMRLRDWNESASNMTERQLLDLGYNAYGWKMKAALKAETLESKVIGDGRIRREKPRSVSGRVKYSMIAGEQLSHLEDWMQHGMEDALHRDLVMDDKDVTKVGERTFVDKNGTMYVGLESPMHPMSQAAAKHGGVDGGREVDWEDVKANVTVMYNAMSRLYTEWESRREAAGLLPCDKESQGDTTDDDDEEEEEVDPAVRREVARMMKPAGRDGIRISTDSRILPWWLKRKLAFLVTPAREALRIAALLSVVVSFGAGVEYTNLLLKGPRRTTPRPVRTTTGLPY